MKENKELIAPWENCIAGDYIWRADEFRIDFF
jgi:hypothetical protein